MDALEREQALIAEYDEELREAAARGADVFDVHVHLGLDIDGFGGDYDELRRIRTGTAISRAFMFCLDEPDRHPAFRAANDRTLAFAARSRGPADPVRAARHHRGADRGGDARLDPGAKGIKLHPRAQRFHSTTSGSRRSSSSPPTGKVPILIHGGRGLPPIADDLSGSSTATRGRS